MEYHLLLFCLQHLWGKCCLDSNELIKKKHATKERGSYTVEISFIMPMVLGIMVLVLYICMYIHDVAYMECVAIGSLDKLNYMIRDDQYEQMIYEDIVENMRGTMACWCIEVSVDSNAEEVEVEVDAVMSNHQRLFDQILFSKIFGARIRLRGTIQNEEDWIRLR